MTPREAREALGWSARQLARHYGVDERAVRDWESGRHPYPAAQARWLARMARWWARFPPPRRRLTLAPQADDGVGPHPP